MQKIISFLAVLLITSNGFAQCCSGGSSFGSSANVGIVEKSNLRVTAFFRHSYSEDYYQGDKIVPIGSLQNAYFNSIGTVFGYGISRRLTAELEFGYFLSKKQVYKLLPDNPIIGTGLSNGVLSLKYNLFNKPSINLEYTAGLGLKFPFPIDPVYTGGYSIDIQPSTGAYGLVFHSFLSKKFPSQSFRLILVNRYEYNMVNDKSYQFGNTLFSSLFITTTLDKNLMGVLQFRNEFRTKDTKPDKTQDNNTGGSIFLVSPQISYTVYKGWSTALAVDVPFFRSYNGKQFANLYSVSLSISKQFSLKNKCKTTINPSF